MLNLRPTAKEQQAASKLTILRLCKLRASATIHLHSSFNGHQRVLTWNSWWLWKKRSNLPGNQRSGTRSA